MKKKVLYSGHSIFEDNYRVGETSTRKSTSKPRKVVRASESFLAEDRKSEGSKPRKVIRTSQTFLVENRKSETATHERRENKSSVSKIYTTEHEVHNSEIDTLRIVGQEIDNKYIIKKPIGHGGMGVIYLAKHKLLQKEYAIKFLYDKNQVYNTDDELEQRFISEASMAVELRHDNLVEVYDISKYKNHFYMVMEYIEGETIEQAIAKGKNFVEQDVIHVLHEVLSALQAIHEKGFVHRDIKPSNIMINQNGVVKVMDFGIAKDLSKSENLTQPNIIIGTLEYMSPEQIMSTDEVSFTSDIYSLGATAYYMLTGENYIEGNNMQKIRAICSGDFYIEIPGISAEFSEVLLRMMNTDKKQRFQNAQEVKEVLALLEKGRE
ncbi:serine/threonine protein kinase [Candidatus Uabimicrobium amorphum]|uniref:Protein kinase n=1 Tax=Uabimicrobium amorphum TaxID=2596890 RepID=A0A5S9IUK8_UABAM|nr:serine/threonine-protein kinase [Candidatus Uabimicrobium amorphum]BBM88017.1 protein kinase [Candidatus Uabimicrobium amorphum]